MEEKKVLLHIDNLHVKFRVRGRVLTAIRGISLDIYENESIAIVGESGSGKSVEAYSIIGLLQNPGKVIGGSITFEGQDVLAKTPAEMVNFRGSSHDLPEPDDLSESGIHHR